MTRTSQCLGLIAAGVAMLAAGTAAPQDLPVIEAKTNPEPVDRLAMAAEVSAARIVVGVMLDAAGPLKEDPGIVAGLAKDWGDAPACTRLISPDALYEGRVEYDLPAVAADRAAILESRIAEPHWQVLTERYGGALAVAVTRGPCDQPSTEHALALWRGDAAAEEPQVTIFVNGQGAGEVFLEVGEAKTLVPCDRAGDRGGVGFDRLCRIDAGLLSAGQSVPVVVQRIAFGAYEDPVTVTLHATAMP